MDRATLFSLVVAETVRPDKAADLPNFLLLAEARIARELRCVEMGATDTLTLTGNAADLPEDFLGLRSAYDDIGALNQVGLGEWRLKQQQQRSFAIASPRKILARVSSLTIDYFARPAALAADGDTNAILEAHPDLYVALLSFYVFKSTQDLELMQTAESVYADARDRLNELADRQRGAPRLGRPYNFASSGGF